MKTRRNLIQIWLLCAAVLPAATSGAQTVTKVAAGESHSLFLKSDGSLWAMGDDYYGQLGDGNYNWFNPSPEQIVASNVTAIAGGDEHSLFLKSDGSLWAMGYNDAGQLGDGTTDNGNYNTNQPEQIVAGPPPTLGISTYSNQTVVFFPTGTGANGVLQMTTNLASGNWVTITNGIPFSGLQITNASGTAFFRLH